MITLAGCYDPSLAPCTVTCVAGETCPGGSACPASGVCDDSCSAPVARLVRNAYFSNWSGTLFRSSSGMTGTGFEISTDGIEDGELVLFIANIDNGNDETWPDPIAPGFTQLDQRFFGNDGQTFVVAWKIADDEPAEYRGTYDAVNLVSGSSAISLVAVTGADPVAPIDAFVSGAESTPETPVEIASEGLVTDVVKTTLVFAAGADWSGTPGSNTFMPPSGYTPLTEITDRGGEGWDWTVQEIDVTTQVAPGATGPVTTTLTSANAGVGWTALIAIAPG